MAIILEGPDAAGKSTLARELQKYFDYDIFSTGPAPKTMDEMHTMSEQHVNLASKRLIIDRVTPISHPIYNKSMADHPVLVACRKQINENPYSVIIYCRPPNEVLMDENNHEWKDYDSPEHIEFILDNAYQLICSYDETMEQLDHIKFNWLVDSVEELADKIKAKGV